MDATPASSKTPWPSRRMALALAVALGAGAVVGTAAFLHLHRSVREALDTPTLAGRPLRFVPVSPARALETWGGGEVESLVATGSSLVAAGAFGVQDATSGLDLSAGLPTLRVAAAAAWRGQLVVGLEAGGLFRRGDGGWEEARGGWGTLHVRALTETAGGELLIAAREGLFRAAWGATALERLDEAPARAVVEAPGCLLVGGERGLARIESGRRLALDAPDEWIESLALADDEVLAVTAAGLARGPAGGPLRAVPGGDDLVQGVLHDGVFWAVAAPPDGAVRRLAPGERLRHEPLPARVRRISTAAGTLHADTEDGLYRREAGSWRLVRPRVGLPPGAAHVTALAWHGGRLVAGFFDGGLAVASAAGDDLTWSAVPGSAAWGVNALLPAGGELWVASLRGAARFDGARLRPIDGPGAAFSLAATRDGVAIGYGQGVLLPGATLVSAFHGLPGNQALALAEGESLFVGTPSGLGALDGRRVRFSVTPGEGKLPHPWVTALLAADDGVYVGTYGGGVARRSRQGRASGRPRADEALYEAFPETRALKVNPGCLVEAEGRVFAGTDGGGLWGLSPDRRRFERLTLALPSPRVTALAARHATLWVGTDQGLARIRLSAGGQPSPWNGPGTR